MWSRGLIGMIATSESPRRRPIAATDARVGQPMSAANSRSFRTVFQFRIVLTVESREPESTL